MENIDSKKTDLDFGMCYNPNKTKEKEMSNIVVYNGGTYALIGSDSRNIAGNIIKDDYKKIFAFEDIGVLIGVYGTTTFVGENRFQEEVGDIITRCIRNNKDTGDLLDIILAELAYRNLGDGTGILFLRKMDRGIQIKHAFISPNNVEVKILVPINAGYTYGTFHIANFISESISTPEGIKKMIKTNEEADKFIHNPAVIGGPIQLFRISLDDGIEDFSDIQ